MNKLAGRIGVVGAGVAGLAAARRLAARGDLEVVVWDAADRPGGVLATSRADGFTREHAANGFLAGGDEGGAALAAELGVEVVAPSSAARRRWIYRDGRLVPVTPGALLGGELVSRRGLLRALGEPLRPLRPGGPGAAGDESVAAFFRRRLGGEVVPALVAPLCTGVYAGDPEELSMAAAFPKLAELEAEGGLLRAGVTRGVRRLLAGGGERAGLVVPAGGMQALIDALAAELGDRIELGAAAVAVELERGGRAAGVRLADGRLEPCDAVVLAVPAQVAARLVSDASGELSVLLGQITTAGVAVVHLGYRAEDLGRMEPGFGFLVAPGEELRVLGAVFESSIVPGRAPAGHALIRCMLGGVRDPAVLDLTDEELVETAHRDLRRALGLTGAPVHRHVVRWPRAIAQYTVGHQARVARADALAEPLGVVLAGSSYHGVAVNACVADARRVVHRVAAHLALPLAALLVASTGLGAGGCSSGASSGPGPAEAPGDAGGAAASGGAAGDEAGQGGSPGSLEITVEWLDPPAAAVASPGRNPCGAAARPALAVGPLGGVAGAVVRVERGGDAGATGPAAGATGPAAGAAGAPDMPQVALRRCEPEPRALRLDPGARVALTSADERRHEITLARIDPAGAATPLGTVPLVLVGQRMELVMAEPGLYQLTPATEPRSATLLAVGPADRIAVTDEQGRARFEDLPPGRHRVVVWHPPVAPGGPALERRAEVEVSASKPAGATVSLAPEK